jgi:hypothetical protein
MTKYPYLIESSFWRPISVLNWQRSKGNYLSNYSRRISWTFSYLNKRSRVGNNRIFRGKLAHCRSRRLADSALSH